MGKMTIIKYRHDGWGEATSLMMIHEYAATKHIEVDILGDPTDYERLKMFLHNFIPKQNVENERVVEDV